MPISILTTERWICDRCGEQRVFPDDDGRSSRECGWLLIDLGASLRNPTDRTFSVNKQVLCPICLDKLRLWFENTTTPAATAYNKDEMFRYQNVLNGRKSNRNIDLTHDERELAEMEDRYANDDAPWEDA